MKKQTKEKIRSWVVGMIVFFMVLMLVLAYMPGLFVSNNAKVERDREVATSTRE